MIVNRVLQVDILSSFLMTELIIFHVFRLVIPRVLRTDSMEMMGHMLVSTVMLPAIVVALALPIIVLLVTKMEDLTYIYQPQRELMDQAMPQ